MKKLLYILLLLLGSLSAQAEQTPAQIKTQADSAFTKEHYTEALRLYHQLASQGESASVYYNLGCTYYRLDSIPQSILWLERAKLLDPSDDDIQFNLDMARSKTIDRIIPQREMFFVTFWRALVGFTTASGWGYIGLGIFFLAMLCLMLYFYSDRIALRKVGLLLCFLCFLCVVMANVCAYQQAHQQANRTGAIIMTSAVTVKSTPSQSGTDLFVIHEGTYVNIQDDSMKQWVEIKLSDGKVGWMPRQNLEKI